MLLLVELELVLLAKDKHLMVDIMVEVELMVTVELTI